MRRVINGWTSTERFQMLTLLDTLCILQYQIDEDWFSFCRQDTTEGDITGTIPNFLALYLEETVRDLARKVVLVPGDFPRDQLKILQEGTTPMDYGGKNSERGLGILTPQKVPHVTLGWYHSIGTATGRTIATTLPATYYK